MTRKAEGGRREAEGQPCKWKDNFRFLLSPFAFLLCCALAAGAGAQQYPSKPVRIIVPVAAGGGTDVVTRFLGAKLTEALGQQIIVENRAGAGSTIGIEFGMRAAPDIAGRNVADPYALVMSGQMLLEWLGRKRDEPRAVDAARRIEAAVERVIDEGKALTPDLGGNATTTQMGDAIASAV